MDFWWIKVLIRARIVTSTIISVYTATHTLKKNWALLLTSKQSSSLTDKPRRDPTNQSVCLSVCLSCLHVSRVLLFPLRFRTPDRLLVCLQWPLPTSPRISLHVSVSACLRVRALHRELRWNFAVSQRRPTIRYDYIHRTDWQMPRWYVWYTQLMQGQQPKVYFGIIHN